VGEPAVVLKITDIRTHFKNRILVQDRGGAELSSVAGLPA
jgi:hypothetical protein